MKVGSKHTLVVWTISGFLIGWAYWADEINSMTALLFVTIAFFGGAEMGRIAQNQSGET